MDARRAEATAHAGGLVQDSRLRKGTPTLSGQERQHLVRELVTFMSNHQLLAPELTKCQVQRWSLYW